MRMASKSIDLISKKTNLLEQHTFWYISLLSFCMTKTRNFLVTKYFYGGIVVCARQKFCCLCSCSLLFFHCCSFSACWLLLAGCQHFSFSHCPYKIFMFFFQPNSPPLFSIPCSSSFSIIHLSVNMSLISLYTQLSCRKIFTLVNLRKLRERGELDPL